MTNAALPVAARRVAEMAPYPLADPPPDGDPVIMLAQNESLRPPSPSAIEAAQTAATSAAAYPDADWSDLRRAIADVHALDPTQLIVGAGSMELISAIATAYLDPGAAALTTEHGYLFFRTTTRLAGGRVDLAPEKDRVVDIDQLLAAVRPDTRVVFVANPGNPTGTWLASNEIERLRSALPSHVLLIVDEAYGEFVDGSGAGCLHLVARGDTIVLRTFSKAYGLAGMRVGWGVFPDHVAKEVRKALNPSSVSAPALAAAAAAMRDQDYMRETVALTTTGREAFIASARTLGLSVGGGCANFALVGLPSPGAASALERALRRERVIVRKMDSYGLSACLRVTIADAATMAIATDRLSKVIREGDLR